MNLNELMSAAIQNRPVQKTASKKERGRNLFMEKMWLMESSPKPGTLIRCTDRDYVITKEGPWKRVEGSLGKSGENNL